MSTVKAVEVYDAVKKKYMITGHIRNGIYMKKVKKNHFCWKHHAFGIQLEAWSILKTEKVQKLMFHYNRKDWLISMDKADTVKIGDNLGHGAQYFIPKGECTCF